MNVALTVTLPGAFWNTSFEPITSALPASGVEP